MRNFIAVLLLFVSNLIIGQNPIQWNTSVEQVTDSTYTLLIQANIKANWHLYAINQPLGKEAAIIPTEFSFQGEGEDFVRIGGVEEGESTTEMDKIFEQELSYFADNAVFKQTIKIDRKS